MPKKLTQEEYIQKAKYVHGDRYDYSKAVYTKSDETVVLVCSEHGEFKQRAADHLAGKGCSSCSGTKKLTQDEFLTKAVAVHGDKYDYKHVVYVNGITKVRIVCAEHGEFLQTPASHLGGHGCIVCGDAQLLTTEEWIKKAVAVHGEKYDYSEADYRGQHATVKIRCSVHGVFEQRAGQHTHLEAGCPFCAGRQVNEINCLATTHPELAAEWHPVKNGDLTPNDVVAGSRQRAWWKCSVADDHEWETRIGSRLSKNAGCPCCSGHKVVPSNCLATLKPSLAEQWHPTKNGELQPTNVVAGYTSKVWWKCPAADDHEWEATPYDRIRENGDHCPFCINRRVAKSNCLATTHPSLIGQWSNKNADLKPQDITCGYGGKVWWKCAVADDHEWEATPKDRVQQGQGCPCCAGKKVSKTNSLATILPDVAAEWHPTKNGKLTPHNVTYGAYRKVWWKCPAADDHEWEATISNRKNTGCPFCNESKGEKKIVAILGKMGLKFKRQARFKTCRSKKELPFDFLVRLGDKKGILIEYHGVQHYKPVRWDNNMSDERMLAIFEGVKKRDKIKEEWAKKRNIPLLVVPHWDKQRIPELIEKFIKEVA